MVAWRRLGTVVVSLLVLSGLSIVWNVNSGAEFDVVQDHIPPSSERPTGTVQATVASLGGAIDGNGAIANDSAAPLCVVSPSVGELRIVRREKAAQRYCPSRSPTCLLWVVFPPHTAADANSAGCDFLCTQASESRPAVWKQSMMRTHSIVDAPPHAATADACPLLVSPTQCVLQGPIRGEPHVSLLFIGHSHTRFLASMVCMMLNATSCQQLDDQFRNIAIVREADLERSPGVVGSRPSSRFVRIAFVQANYHFGNKVRMMQADFTAAELASFTHVIYSRGSWDLLFYDRPPNEIADDLRSSLVHLSSVLSPTVRRVLHLHHHVHYKPDGGSSAKKKGPNHAAIRAAWRRTCFAPSRVEQIRDATLCGSWDSDNTSAGPPVSVYDTFAETKTSIGFQFVDILGHHYQDVMLEFLAMKFLREHVCPPARSPLPPRLLLTADVASKACKRTLAATKAFRIVTECACHHPTERRDQICKRFGRSVPDVARRL
jgi:hypothetical protein